MITWEILIFFHCIFLYLLYNYLMEVEELKKDKRNLINDKREFISYILKIKEKVDIRKMLDCYIQHGNTSVYIHSRNVAYLSFKMAKSIERKFHKKIDYKTLITGAMFHDFFLYDWHKPEGRPKLHGYRHPLIASQNAQKYYNITDKEKIIIENHMWPLTLTKYPNSLEAKIVCTADKCCSLKETIHRK